MTDVTDHSFEPVPRDLPHVVRVHPLEPVPHDPTGRVAVLRVVGQRAERTAQGIEAAAGPFDAQPALELLERLADCVVGVDVADAAGGVVLHVLLYPRVPVLRHEQQPVGATSRLGRGTLGQVAVDRDRGDGPEGELADLLRLRPHPVDEEPVGVDDARVVGEVGDVALAHAGIHAQQDEREHGRAPVLHRAGDQHAALGRREDRDAVGVLALADLAADLFLRPLAERVVLVQRDADQLRRLEGPAEHPADLRHGRVELIRPDALAQGSAELVEPARLLPRLEGGGRLDGDVLRDHVEEVDQARAADLVVLPGADLLAADPRLLDGEEAGDDLAGGDRVGGRDGRGADGGLSSGLDVGGDGQVGEEGLVAAEVVGPLAEVELARASADPRGAAPLAVGVGEEREGRRGFPRLDDPRGAVTIPSVAAGHDAPSVRYELGYRILFRFVRTGVRFRQVRVCRSVCRGSIGFDGAACVRRGEGSSSTRSSIGQSIGLRRRSAGTLTRVSTPRTRSVNSPLTAETPNSRLTVCRATLARRRALGGVL